MEAVERLELTVEILLLIAFVNIRMEADSILVVDIEVAQLNGIPAKRNVGEFKLNFLVHKDV